MTEPLRIRMAAASGHTFGVDDLAVGAAAHLGFWERLGIVPEWTAARGGVAAMQALVDGQVDVAYAGNGPAIRLRAGDAPTRIIVSMARALGQALVAQAQIKSTEDLRGARWAVDGINAMSHHLAMLILRALQIPSDQVTFLVKGPPPNRIEALLSGEANCSLIRLEEAAVLSRQQETLHTLLGFDDLRRLVPMQPHGVLATREDYAEANPEVLVKVAQGMIETSRALHHKRDSFVDAMNRCLDRPVDVEILDELWAGLHEAGVFAVNGGMSIGRWRQEVDLYFELYPDLAGKVSLLELLDPQFTARALSRIGVDDALFDPPPGMA